MVGLQNNGEESRRAEAALREGEEHFRLLVKGVKTTPSSCSILKVVS